MKNLFVYSLSTLDWSFSIGGEHLTGDVSFYENDTSLSYKKIELERSISLKEAKYLAEKDDMLWMKPLSRKTNRFNNEKEVEKAAKRFCEEHAKDKSDWVLIHRNIDNPNMPVCGKGEICVRFEAMKWLASEWDKLSNAERTDRMIDTYYKVWKKTIDINKPI